MINFNNMRFACGRNLRNRSGLRYESTASLESIAIIADGALPRLHRNPSRLLRGLQLHRVTSESALRDLAPTPHSLPCFR